MPRLSIWTIGHSTHTIEAFADLLAAPAIELVADVRSVPRSRRHPQFSSDALARTLPERGVAYRHLRALGGWRSPRADSPNTAWRNASFRGYADYALTGAFAEALAALRDLARERRTAVMCAEALWWRCHRRLIADRLSAGGWDVWHIGADGRLAAHPLTESAVIQSDGTIVYPG